MKVLECGRMEEGGEGGYGRLPKRSGAEPGQVPGRPVGSGWKAAHTEVIMCSHLSGVEAAAQRG